MKKLFMNSEGRLRCGWRLLIQFYCFLTLVFIIQAVQGLAVERRSLALYALGSVVYLAGIGILFWILARWVDRRRIGDYGFRVNPAWWSDLAVGLIMAGLSLTLVVLIEQALGWANFVLHPTSVFAGPFVMIGLGALLNLTAIAAAEELTFRGFQMRNLAEGLKVFMGSKRAVGTAWVMTSILFGIVHLVNPNATLMSAVNVTLAGLILGLGYILTGELALPIGIHLAWGFFEEFIFGFPNSGQSPLSYLISSRVTGPDLWTGGSFGPEAGLLVSGVLVLDAFIIIAWIKMRRRWRAMREDIAEYPNVGDIADGSV